MGKAAVRSRTAEHRPAVRVPAFIPDIEAGIGGRDWLGRTVTDLFAGGGGSSEGLFQAGYKIRISTNHDPESVATHEANHPDTEHRTADLTNTNFGSYPRTDVLWASPSCRKQRPTSKQGSVEDELRMDTFDKVDRATAFAVLAATEVHGYDAVIVENVPKFLDWVLKPLITQGMQLLGYREQVVFLNAADVGPNPPPQDRRRVFLVYTRDGNVDLTVPEVVRTPATAILDQSIPSNDPDMSRTYLAPQLASIPVKNVPHLVTFRKNARARRADCSLLQTLCAGGRHHALATVTDEGTDVRWLSTLELARAQGFPDSYVFLGSDTTVRKQIGNAVSVNVARFLGERVADALGWREPGLVAA